MVERAATSFGVFASVAPAATSSSTGLRLRWPITVKGKPFATMLLAMPCPIRPTPMKPTDSFVALIFKFSRRYD
ncbi:hypothetical protein D3C86_1999710 [compost metagenome]